MTSQCYHENSFKRLPGGTEKLFKKKFFLIALTSQTPKECQGALMGP